MSDNNSLGNSPDNSTGNSPGNSKANVSEYSNNSKPILNVNDIDPELRGKLEDRQQGITQQTFPIILNIQPASPLPPSNIASTPNQQQPPPPPSSSQSSTATTAAVSTPSSKRPNDDQLLQKEIALLQKEPQQPSPASASVSLRSPLNSPRAPLIQSNQTIDDSNNASPVPTYKIDDVDVDSDIDMGGNSNHKPQNDANMDVEREQLHKGNTNNNNEVDSGKQVQTRGYSLQLDEEGATITEEPPSPKVGELPPAEDLVDDGDDDDDDDDDNNNNNNNDKVNNNNNTNNDNGDDADVSNGFNGHEHGENGHVATDLLIPHKDSHHRNAQNAQNKPVIPSSPRKESRKRSSTNGNGNGNASDGTSARHQRLQAPSFKRKKLDFTEKNDRDILDGVRNSKTWAQITRENKMPFSPKDVERRYKQLARRAARHGPSSSGGDDHIPSSPAGSLSASSGLDQPGTDRSSSSIQMLSNGPNGLNGMNGKGERERERDKERERDRDRDGVPNMFKNVGDETTGNLLSSGKRVTSSSTRERDRDGALLSLSSSSTSSRQTITQFFPKESESSQITKLEETLKEKEKEFESKIAELDRSREEQIKKYEEELKQKEMFIVNIINILIRIRIFNYNRDCNFIIF